MHLQRQLNGTDKTRNLVEVLWVYVDVDAISKSPKSPSPILIYSLNTYNVVERLFMRYNCALVDVDNTLFDFATPLYKTFIDEEIFIPPPASWNSWEYFVPKYMTSKVAHDHFDMVHSRQLEFEPFADARVFLEHLIKDRAVIVVSHRRTHQCNELRKWLNKHDLPYDMVECCADKTKMFNKSVFDVVVDDCPGTINAAVNAGIKGYGLSRPWNASCKVGTFLPTLTDIGKVGGWM